LKSLEVEPAIAKRERIRRKSDLGRKILDKIVDTEQFIYLGLGL
jgi:hypothetical protein